MGDRKCTFDLDLLEEDRSRREWPVKKSYQLLDVLEEAIELQSGKITSEELWLLQMIKKGSLLNKYYRIGILNKYYRIGIFSIKEVTE